MRTAVTTFYSNSYEPLAAITIPPLQMWCDKNGYDLHIHKIGDNESFHFVKTKDARKLLDEYDVVMMIENDILLTNLTYRIEHFLQYGTYLTICKDINNFNGGCVVIRNSKWSKDLLDLINEFESVYGDEQNFMEKWFGTDLFCTIIGTLKHPALNSIAYEYYAPSYGYLGYKDGEKREMPTHDNGCWDIGDFCCHLPGKTLAERISIFNEIKQHIIYE